MTATYSSQLLSSVWAKRPTVFHCNIQWPRLYFFHRNKIFKSLKAKTFKVRFTCSHFYEKFLSHPTKTRAFNSSQNQHWLLGSQVTCHLNPWSVKRLLVMSLRAAVWNVLCPDSTLTALICTHPEDTTPLCSDSRGAGCSWGRFAGAAWKMTVLQRTVDQPCLHQPHQRGTWNLTSGFLFRVGFVQSAFR